MKRALSITLVFFTFLTIAPAASAATACLTVKIGSPDGKAPEQPAECTAGTGLDCKEKPKDYPSDLQKAIKDKFGITMNGFDNETLKWAWEKLHCTASSKFNDLVKGAVISQASGRFSKQVGCPPGPTVELHKYDNEAFFKFIFTHELGHSIRNCKPRNVNKYNEHLNAIKAEGAISYYGGHASSCTGSDNASEDYADTMAYFVTPDAGFSSGPCGPKNPPNPYYKASDKKAEHLTKVAEPVLKK
jgi:hypothetical protein